MFLDVFVLFIFMVLIMENWLLVQPSVSFLDIHALKKAIDITVQIVSITLWVLTSLSSSLNHFFLNTFLLSPLHPTFLYLHLFLCWSTCFSCLAFRRACWVTCRDSEVTYRNLELPVETLESPIGSSIERIKPSIELPKPLTSTLSSPTLSQPNETTATQPPLLRVYFRRTCPPEQTPH